LEKVQRPAEIIFGHVPKTPKDALAQSERTEEKRLVLSALGNIPTADALAMVVSHLEDAGLKEEACQAAVTIAEKLGAGRAEVTAAMQQVAKLTTNKKLAGRANALIRQSKK
jgi:hypothetical protein